MVKLRCWFCNSGSHSCESPKTEHLIEVGQRIIEAIRSNNTKTEEHLELGYSYEGNGELEEKNQDICGATGLKCPAASSPTCRSPLTNPLAPFPFACKQTLSNNPKEAWSPSQYAFEGAVKTVDEHTQRLVDHGERIKQCEKKYVTTLDHREELNTGFEDIQTNYNSMKAVCATKADVDGLKADLDRMQCVIARKEEASEMGNAGGNTHDGQDDNATTGDGTNTGRCNVF
ncbi:hypothetical protein QBC35DRAFT_465289 [Podospora australis]|uniref:Uncharacterized protein n=1 Tax=Podospora australis TaxID=1536484 RepID=A0AAN7AFX4_9PEZI|nr:hypothetical protein QBC35DRAFT_465289 [Podospora australis]